MKPVLYLDPEMPKTHMVPDNDNDGRLFNEYFDLCLDLQFADSEFPERIEAAKKACADFVNAHSWKQAPLVQQQTLLLGPGSAMRGYGKERCDKQNVDSGMICAKEPIVPKKSYVTHPDNVADIDPERLAQYDVRPMKTHAEYT